MLVRQVDDVVDRLKVKQCQLIVAEAPACLLGCMAEELWRNAVRSQGTQVLFEVAYDVLAPLLHSRIDLTFLVVD